MSFSSEVGTHFSPDRKSFGIKIQTPEQFPVDEERGKSQTVSSEVSLNFKHIIDNHLQLNLSNIGFDNTNNSAELVTDRK